jgi:hypothetical protein
MLKLTKVVFHSQMIDSGSSLLSLPCNTPASASRKCHTNGNYYTLDPNKMLTQEQCQANTTGCFNPLSSNQPQGSCAWSSALTGGHGYNGEATN